MKKAIALLSAVVMLFVFASCDSEPTQTQTQEPTVSETEQVERTAEQWIDFVSSQVPFDDSMTKVGAEQAKSLYGIFEEDGYTGDCALYISTMATPEEVAVFKADENITIDELYKKAEARLEQQKQSYSDYAPAEVPKLESAVIEFIGDTMIVIVSADNALAKEILN